MDFLKSPAKIRLIIGGNRTGKSTIGIIEDISHCMGFRPDGTKTNLPHGAGDYLMMVANRHKSVDKIVMNKLKQYCGRGWITEVKNGTDGLPEKVTFSTGSRLFIGSYNQHPDHHEGIDWHGVHFDEPPPRKLWIAIRRGLLDHGGRAWFTLTPLSCPWIYNELYLEQDGINIEVFHLDLMENPFISDYEKEQFSASLLPEEREARIHGHFSHLQGRIFPEFKREVHCVKPFPIPSDWPRFMAMDPHDRRPNYMLWAAVDPRDRIYLYREWPTEDFSKIKIDRRSIQDYAALIRTIEGPDPEVVERAIDPNFGRTPSASSGQTPIEDFEDHGVFFEGDLNNDIAHGHNRIHHRLRTDIGPPSLYVFQDLYNMNKAFENYTWNEKDMSADFSAKERPGEFMKDPIDTLRYLLDLEPRYGAGDFVTHDYSSSKGGYGA